MAIKGPKPEEIVVKLRQVEVQMVQGMPRIEAIRQISVTEPTYYRWSAGGKEKRPVVGFPAKQVRRTALPGRVMRSMVLRGAQNSSRN